MDGNDRSAITRQEFPTFVWKSIDDGETWVDETGDLATISTGHGRWYESDFYLITQGEGVTVKRNFEWATQAARRYVSVEDECWARSYAASSADGVCHVRGVYVESRVLVLIIH